MASSSRWLLPAFCLALSAPAFPFQANHPHYIDNKYRPACIDKRSKLLKNAKGSRTLLSGTNWHHL